MVDMIVAISLVYYVWHRKTTDSQQTNRIVDTIILWTLDNPAHDTSGIMQLILFLTRRHDCSCGIYPSSSDLRHFVTSLRSEKVPFFAIRRASQWMTAIPRKSSVSGSLSPAFSKNNLKVLHHAPPRSGSATMPTQYSGAGLMVWWTWIAMRGLLPIEFWHYRISFLLHFISCEHWCRKNPKLNIMDGDRSQDVTSRCNGFRALATGSAAKGDTQMMIIMIVRISGNSGQHKGKKGGKGNNIDTF
ncbi:hypothetical protein B0H13DRAFT_1902473 [Mycena leptocephala]|nr:hypothetical protein B0H13DRAFT_1902473 [Mycena leptocephala]